jgi:NitT/TauT family transport system substrate-binding protein
MRVWVGCSAKKSRRADVLVAATLGKGVLHEMHIERFRQLLSLFAIVLLLLAVGTVSAQDETTDQTFFMTFIPNIQFAPVYVALENGYFADAGINLTTEYGDEPVGVDLIAAGQRQFGLASGEQILAARANGRPVVMVYEWFQQFPIGVAYPLDSGIQTVNDLTGRNVGIPGRFGASYTGLIALLAANGMTESDIELEEIGFNAPEVICVGGVEAAVVYTNNEPLQINNRAAAGDCGDISGVEVFSVADAANMVSNGIVTNEDTVANDPDLVRAMVGAFDNGLRDTINNPAQAYLLSVPYVENLPMTEEFEAALIAAAEEQAEFLEDNPDADREMIAARRAELLTSLRDQFDDETLLQFEVLLTTIELWEAEQLGYSDLADWETTQETLMTMGYITEPQDVSAAYTNEFLPVE